MSLGLSFIPVLPVGDEALHGVCGNPRSQPCVRVVGPANYLSVGQIYLFDNPLLRKPLEAEHVKPRLLGH